MWRARILLLASAGGPGPTRSLRPSRPLRRARLPRRSSTSVRGVGNTANLSRFVADTVLVEGYGFEPPSRCRNSASTIRISPRAVV